MTHLTKSVPRKSFTKTDTRLYLSIKAMKLIRQCRKKNHRYTIGQTSVDFHPILPLIFNPSLNEITREVMDKSSPVMYTYKNLKYEHSGVFKASIYADNVKLGLEYLNDFDVEHTLSGMPFDCETITKILRSDHVVEILNFLADNKDEIIDK